MRIKTPDVLVIGLGAMGAATVYQLAKRGVHVVGIDRFSPPHIFGSTHGETRITRQAIGEGAQFVPLALRSHQLWREMEAATGASLFNQCGGIIIARAGAASHMHAQADFYGNTIAAAEAFAIPHEQLNAAEIEARFPQFALQGDEVAYYEPGAGFVFPETCVATQLQLAKQHGAALHLGESVQRITATAGGTVVETSQARYQAGTTVICAGPWMPTLVPSFASRVVVSRQVLHWFPVTDEVSYQSANCPVYIWHWGDGPDDVFYGFPQASGEPVIKVATEQSAYKCNPESTPVSTPNTTPDTVCRDVSAEELERMFRRHVQHRLKHVNGAALRSATCLYTSTSDANFIIDRLPDQSDTIVVSACSGHGFKHSAAIGEAVAEMAIGGTTPDVLMPFQLRG